MNVYLICTILLIAISLIVFFLWKKVVPNKIKMMLSSWFQSLKPSVQCHIRTSIQLVITLFFSLLPAILEAMSEGSQSINWIDILISDLREGSVFVYTPAFLAQFFILTLTHEFTKSGEMNIVYKFILLFSFYSCFMGR